MNDGVEKAIREAFAEALGAEQVAPDDDFFQLGGHSLLVMRAAARIGATLGVDLPVSVIFERPTARRLAAHVAALELPARRRGSPSAAVTAATDTLGLSPLQRGMWFLDQGVGWHTAYLLPDAWRLRGPLDTDALQRALHALLGRHAALSARYVLVDGKPCRRIVGAGPTSLSVHDLGTLHSDERDTRCSRLIADEANRPFDLARDPLIRASLIRLAAEDHVLLLTVHHLAADAWSLHILRRELGEMYGQCRAGLVAGAASSRRGDATGWIPELSHARRKTLLAYWGRQLQQLPPLELPTDRHRPSVWTDAGREFEFTIAPALTRRLNALASSCGATLQMLLLAAFQLVLARYSGQDEFGVASFASNRPDEARDAIGLYVNTIVLRANLAGAPSFRALLARVRQTSLEAYDHRDLPFDTLVSELRANRPAGPRPFTNVAFQYLPIADAPPAFEGIDASRLPNPTGRVRFDLEFTIRKETDRLHGLVAYSSGLWDGETITRLAGQYSATLGAIADSPDVSLAELPAVSDEERHEQLASWSGVNRLPGVHGVVHELFEARAAATPERVALTCGDGHVSYGELAARADQIASLLRAERIGAGQVVAILASNAMALVTCMVGTLKAGAAYMPLDPEHPVDRLRFMLRHAGAAAVLCSPAAPEWLRDGLPPAIDVPAGAIRNGVIAPPADRAPMTPDAPAYVMFTSGSTGRPKGVMVAHRGITRLVIEADYVDFSADDGVAFASNPAFDAATFEIWGALLNGARLIAVERETLLSPLRLADAIAERGISVMFLTAALFHQVAAIAPDSFTGLRCLIVGGDVVDPVAAGTVLRASRPDRLVNGYGPTENTTFSTTFRVTPEHAVERALPIGRPVPGSTCYVLDDHHSLLPVGAVGELYVGGAGLFLGYVNDEVLTAARFVPHPLFRGERLYSTGDRVRWRWDGQLQFLGRTDRQVKLRGHRIELEEIEHALRLHPTVTACAVMMEATPSEDSRLVAYVSTRDGRAVPPGALTDHLRQRLPEFMIPAAFVELPALPLTANGKVDHAALRARGAITRPAPDLAVALDTTSLRNEALVITAFRKVLCIDRVQPDHDFFSLGGDSLTSIRLAAELTARSGRTVSATDVFAHPRVWQLSAMLNDMNARVAPETLVEVRAGGPGTPIYFPPGALGEVVVTPPLRDALPANVPIYALRDPLTASPAASIEAMAARLCADLMAFQPQGPVSLAGFSFAGLLAYEMARQLRAAGRDIRVLAIFDTGPDQSAGGGVRALPARVRLCLANLPAWIAEDLIRSMGRDTPGRLWRSLKKHVRAGFRFRPAAPGVVPKVNHLFDVGDWTPELYAHVENNLRILGSFQYRPYDGDLVLFRARARPLLHAQTWDLGWQSLARSVRVIPTPGNHHTLMLEPHIHYVARSLAAVVEAAESSASDRSRRLATPANL